MATIKGPRLNYYGEVIKFYAELKALCEKLKEYPKDSPDKKKTRNYILRQELGKKNEQIKQFFENSFKETQDMDLDVQDLFRGILLPFDDTTRVDDNFNNIIVNIIPEYSMCFSTKARVPIKIVVECITVFECKKWSQLYREEAKSQLQEFSIFEGDDQNIISPKSTESPLGNRPRGISSGNLDSASKDKEEIDKKKLLKKRTFIGKKSSLIREKLKINTSNQVSFLTPSSKRVYSSNNLINCLLIVKLLLSTPH